MKVSAQHLAGLMIPAILLCGCTSWRDYVHNGFKVGPNYCPPSAPVAQEWIDAADKRVRSEDNDLSRWWTVFNDPALDTLICCAYHQNLTLRQAGCRILQARAQLAIAVGNIFPQNEGTARAQPFAGSAAVSPISSQPSFDGDFSRNASSLETANGKNITQPFFSQWNFGFNLNWELDFWGRFRRAVESNAANLDASVEDYDGILVTLLGDVATNYVQMRTFEQRILYTRKNVELQRKTLTIAEARFHGGTSTARDPYQARSTLEQTEAQIPELEIQLRLAINQLCTLLGIPPEELRSKLGPAPIPTAPTNVCVGIPADLLRRRPDVRRAERQVATQCPLIGVAEADLYPAISINGTLGYSAERFSDLFQPTALNSTIGPSFEWNLLNYGRIVNNVRFQNARLAELVAAYQETVLNANQEAENGLVTFLRAQESTKLQTACVNDAEKAVEIAQAQYDGGQIDLTPVTLLQQSLVQQQDVLVQDQGQIATGLVQVYRALGGGWELRLTGCTPSPLPLHEQPAPDTEPLPTPSPELAPEPPKPAPADKP
jgi:NodT family efflux transporter outer membrane factor (OMF) lipoprotein